MQKAFEVLANQGVAQPAPQTPAETRAVPYQHAAKPKYLPGTALLCLSVRGRAKRIPIHLVPPERPPALGVQGFALPEGDRPLSILVARPQDVLAAVTDKGRLLRVLVQDIPTGTLASPPESLLNGERFLESEHLVGAVILQGDIDTEVFVVSQRGRVQRLPSTWLGELERPPANTDSLLDWSDTPRLLTQRRGQPYLLLVTRTGWVIKVQRSFLSDVGTLSPWWTGEDAFVGAAWVWEDDPLLLMSASGQARRLLAHSLFENAAASFERTRLADAATLVGMAPALDGDEIFCLTHRGRIGRIAAKALPIMTTSSSPVQLIALTDDTVAAFITARPPRLAQRLTPGESFAIP